VAERSGAVSFPLATVASDDPIDTTPHVLDGRVYAIVRAGDRVIVGGTFTTVRNAVNPRTQYTRRNLFAYSHSTGRVDTSFVPDINGEVNSLVLSQDGRWVFVGGRFTSVNGVAQRGVTKLAVDTGARNTSFAGRVAGGVVYDMARAGNALYVGGSFTSLSGVPRGRLGAVHVDSGAPLPLDLPVTNPRLGSAVPRLEKLDVDAAGRRLVIIGNFLAVGGVAREQLAVIDLTTSPPSVANWSTNRFGNVCSPSFTTYMRDVDISPDGTWFAVNTTGAWRGTATLCDTTSRWELGSTGSDVQPTWVDHTGGDTLYAVAVTEAAVYVGGHQRWENNATPARGDVAGPGAVSRAGIAALDPLTGLPLSWNPGKDRGVGTFAITPASDALHIGSDTNRVAGELHPRLAAFPVAPGGTANPAPEQLQLPVILYRATESGLQRSTFDGTNVSGPTQVQQHGQWAGARGAFIQHGDLYVKWSDGRFDRRPFAEASLDTPTTDLLTLPGYTVAVPNNLTNAVYLGYGNGRLFYRRPNDGRLWWRWFSLESGVVGAQELLASSITEWGTVQAITVVGNSLYATQNNGVLYRATISGGSVGPRSVVDSTTGWTGTTRALFAVPAAGRVQALTSPDPVQHRGRADARIGQVVPGEPGRDDEPGAGDVERAAGEA